MDPLAVGGAGALPRPTAGSASGKDEHACVCFHLLTATYIPLNQAERVSLRQMYVISWRFHLR